VEGSTQSWCVEILARFIALHRGNSSYLQDPIYELPLNQWKDIPDSKVRPGDFFRAFIDVFRIYLRYLAPKRHSWGHNTPTSLGRVLPCTSLGLRAATRQFVGINSCGFGPCVNRR
jgi:hypothetical protein